MKFQCLTHVDYSGLGSISTLLKKRGHSCSITRLHKGEQAPAPDSYDCLLVMGGSMAVHEEELHPWLQQEKEYLLTTLDTGKPLLGICLGAQLIAEVLGAEVYLNRHREIGWFDVWQSMQNHQTPLTQALPDRFKAFHWHSYTFDLPAGATPLFTSEACENQGFIIGDRIIGLQFHPEASPQMVQGIINSRGYRSDPSEYAQDADEMFAVTEYFDQSEIMMGSVLDHLTAIVEPASIIS